MSTIEFPYRPPGYLARQGYVKPLWQIMLRRSDAEPHLTYVPDDEAMYVASDPKVVLVPQVVPCQCQVTPAGGEPDRVNVLTPHSFVDAVGPPGLAITVTSIVPIVTGVWPGSLPCQSEI